MITDNYRSLFMLDHMWINYYGSYSAISGRKILRYEHPLSPKYRDFRWTIGYIDGFPGGFQDMRATHRYALATISLEFRAC